VPGPTPRTCRLDDALPACPPSIRLAARASLRSFGRGGVPIRARTHSVRPLLVVVALTALACNSNEGVSWVGFHGNALRTGWNPQETALRPDVVHSGRFGKRWESPAFDAFNGVPGRAYASPLYVEGVKMAGGPVVDVVFAATSNADVYAVSAAATRNGPAGTVLWKRRLGDPGDSIDGLRVGAIGTPVADLKAQPPRLYVAADVQGPDTDGGTAWRVFALDLTSGRVLPGWPVRLDASTVTPVNVNGPAAFLQPGVLSQRGGLVTSPDGSVLYVPFGGYFGGSVGWLVAIDTVSPRVASSFSSAPEMQAVANGGIWASGGPAVDADGSVWAVTGNSPPNQLQHSWGVSVLRWAPGLPLRLTGTYTPWNHCQLDTGDIDLCGSGVTLLPEVHGTSTPRLAVVGGKQGNVYLLDRDHLPGALDARPPCNYKSPTDSPQDLSLWDPTAARPYYRNGSPGPLNVFGPYSEDDGWANKAKARSTPAVFQAEDGTTYIVVTGSSKDPVDLVTSRPPSVARLRVVTPSPTGPAHLEVEAYETTLTFQSAGTPVISSNGGKDPIAWIVEPNVGRLDNLVNAPPATLHAVDVMQMKAIWSSAPGDLHPGAKYFHPVVARGQVIVATDRVTGFGVSVPLE
jgi:hypothetical protein